MACCKQIRLRQYQTAANAMGAGGRGQSHCGVLGTHPTLFTNLKDGESSVGLLLGYDVTVSELLTSAG